MKHLPALALPLLIAAVFADGLGAGFTLDSSPILRDDPRLRSLDGQNVKLVFTENYWYPTRSSTLYRPLTTLSYQLNAVFAGDSFSPVPFRIVNLLLHWANALLIASLLRRVIKPGLAWFAAAVLAVHPLAVESVTNLVGRADLLATLAMLLGLHAHLRWTEGGSRCRLLMTGVMGAIGVLCKESAITLIGLLVIWDLFCPPASGRRRWIGYCALIPSWIMLWAARAAVLGDSPVFSESGADNPLVYASGLTRILTALSVQGRYMGLFFWPQRLSCDYSFDQIPMWGESWTAAAWLGALPAAAGVVGALGVRHRLIWMLALLAAAVMGPTSNLLFPIGTIMAERFMYLPVAFGAAIVAMTIWSVLQRWPSRWRAPIAALAAAMVIVSLSFRTALRNVDWCFDEWLWASAARACPNNYKVYYSQAAALVQRDGLDRSADAVIALLEESRRIIQTDRLPLIHRPLLVYTLQAQALMHKGDLAAAAVPPDQQDGVSQPFYDRAIQACDLALPIDQALNAASRQSRLARGLPADQIHDVGYAPLHALRAMLFSRKGRLDQAADSIDFARKLKPADPYFHSLAAEILAARKQPESASIRAWQFVLTGGDPSASPPRIASDLDRALRELLAMLRQARDPVNERRILQRARSLPEKNAN